MFKKFGIYEKYIDKSIGTVSYTHLDVYKRQMQDIEREKVRSQKEMKQTITDVAFEAAGKIVGKELSEEQQKKYVDEFIERAGDDSWQA